MNNYRYFLFSLVSMSCISGDLATVICSRDYMRVCCNPEDREKFRKQFERECLEAMGYKEYFLEEDIKHLRSQGRNMVRKLSSTPFYESYLSDIGDHKVCNKTTHDTPSIAAQEIAKILFGESDAEKS